MWGGQGIGEMEQNKVRRGKLGGQLDGINMMTANEIYIYILYIYIMMMLKICMILYFN